MCADALRDWLRAKQEGEIAAYYEGLSDGDRAEDADWVKLAAGGAVDGGVRAVSEAPDQLIAADAGASQLLDVDHRFNRKPEH